MRTIRELAERHDALRAEMAEVVEEMRARAGEVDPPAAVPGKAQARPAQKGGR